MAQNEYEEQPEAPDVAEVLQEDTAESDVGPPLTDPLDAGYVPPDRPLVLDEAPTAAELAEGESLDDRLRRERPDVDDTPVGEDEGGGAHRSGRLIAAVDASGRGSAVEAEDVGIDGGTASAEEAAVHELDE